jgi:hypothetical protein
MIKAINRRPNYFLSRSNYFLSRSDFGVRSSRDYEDATWKWVLGKKYPWRDVNPDAPITLSPVQVIVWDEHGKGANPALTQEFTPDTEGTRAAHQYAKQVISEFGALLSEVQTRVNFPFKYDKAVEFTLYEPET